VRQFDVVLMNPPYQTKSDMDNKKTQAIWHHFVNKSFKINKEGGFVCMIHPSGWRNVKGLFDKAKNMLLTHDIKYLSIHNADEGVKTFGCGTRYDWYVTQNSTYKSKTIIHGEDGINSVIDLSLLPFIPNAMVDKVMNLVAKDGENKVELLWDCNYHTQARKKDGTMAKEKTDEFQYPCVQNVNVKGETSCIWWSNTKANGHFGIPKIIFGRKVCGTLNDKNGEYGLCQDCAAIVDEPKNLSKIQKAMNSEKFIALMKMCDVGGNRDKYNRKVIATFRKDFWKEFVNE